MTTHFLAAGLLLFAAACGGDAEDHEHGADTHTHEAASAASRDTAGTFVDTTGAFFDDVPGDAPAGDTTDGADDAHEHGPDSHTH